MTERNSTATMNTEIINTALRLSPIYANEDSNLLFSLLVSKFPDARLSVIRLIVIRVCALARQGHDRLDREMLIESVLTEIKAFRVRIGAP